MLKVSCLLLFAALLLTGCGKKEESKAPETVKKDTVTKAKEPERKIVSNEFKTKSGKTFNVFVRKNGESISDILVVGQGFENSKDTVSFKDGNPFERAFVTDLNGDGFDELFIVTRAAGSGSYGGVLGVASNKDKSYSMISVQEISEADMQPGKTFGGYMGQDSIYVEKDMLVRVFPIYKPTDTNNNPTGGKRKVMYKLMPGEAAFQLKVSGKEDLK